MASLAYPNGLKPLMNRLPRCCIRYDAFGASSCPQKARQPSTAVARRGVATTADIAKAAQSARAKRVPNSSPTSSTPSSPLTFDPIRTREERAAPSGPSPQPQSRPHDSLLESLTSASTKRRPQKQQQPAGRFTSSLFSKPDPTDTSSSGTSPFGPRRTPSRTARLPSGPTAFPGSAQQADMLRATRLESKSLRKWQEGDIYAPHDLSPAEHMKAQRARSPNKKFAPLRTRVKGAKDVMDELGIDPVKEYKNFSMMSEFVSELGRIRHNRDTELRPVNQRKMARAVRRAVGLGLMPSVHRHPELMEERLRMRGQLVRSN